MPRVTISILAPGTNRDGELLTLHLPAGISVSDLKALVTDETGFPREQILFFHNNAAINDDQQTIEQAGIKDNDMMAMVVHAPTATRMPSQQPARSNPTNASLPSTQDGENEIESIRQNILANPRAVSQLSEMRPELAAAVNDPQRFRAVWMEHQRLQNEQEAENEERIRRLQEDPFDVGAQQQIEEMIRQQSVQDNLQFAYEHNPEVFGRVTMLYVPVQVNKHPVKAFVDSGAQTTIMSPSCAESCGIMRLIDRRYSGIAKGVGTANILGRVHSADIRIGTATMPCAFTVMEGKDVDLLLGLDMLKRFQAIIDLRSNRLVFGDGNEVSFLGEADIPKFFEEAVENEPVAPGPNGTEIGAQSGTVRPAGTAAAAAAASSSSGQAQKPGAMSGVSVPRAGSLPSPAITPTPAGTGEASASASAPAPASTVRGTSEVASKESIEQLIALGFSRSEAIAALEACNGNIEYAAGLLFQQ